MNYTSLPCFKKPTAELIALSLNKGKRIGNNRFKASCPHHNDKNPSLIISEGMEGKVLVHCFSGCTQEQVIGALRDKGLWYPVNSYQNNLKLKREEYIHFQWILKIAIVDIQTGNYRHWSEKDKKDVLYAIDQVQAFHDLNRTRRVVNG